jgi:hypothetical protein
LIYAKAREISVWENAFCISIAWLEVVYGEDVWVMEADEEIGRLVLIGDRDKCEEFNKQAGAMTESVSDPDEQWRYYA